MPSIIDYQHVLAQMTAQRLVCHYFNSGAFGFPRGVTLHVQAWIGPDDPTIRPEARSFVRPVPPPYESTLATLASRFWQDHLQAPAWIMPMSHWAFELEHGSRDWLPPLLRAIGVDPDALRSRNNAAAIELQPSETAAFEHLVSGLLTHLAASDFTIAFPHQPLLCTLHHHKQLWWMTDRPEPIALLDQVRENPSSRGQA